MGEALTVQWPRDLHARMAFLQSDLLVDRLMDAINQIANTPCPLAQREQQIAELKGAIDRVTASRKALSSPQARHANQDACQRSFWLLLDRLEGDETRLPPGLMSALEAKLTCRDGVMT